MPRKKATPVNRATVAKKKVVRKTKTPTRQLMEMPTDTSVGNLADWLEVSVWAQTDQKISREEIMSVFNFGRESEEAQEEIDNIWDEIKLRASHLQDKYPFSLSSNEELFTLKTEDSVNVSYLFCLVMSYFGLSALTAGSVTAGAHLFENLCTYAAEKYISGEPGTVHSMQFGAPRTEWLKKHKPFHKAMDEMIRKLGHGTSRVAEVRDIAHTVAHGGDGGLDVVAWRAFPDDKRGSLILFGQCAAVKKPADYMAKILQLSAFMNENMIAQFPYLFVFFLPHTLTANDPDHTRLWERILSNDNIPFDRNRIALYGNDWVNAPATKLLSQWKKKIKTEHALI
jgi:hypothetical protein